MPIKIIQDVDTGSDDAVALMMAALCPDIELVAACSVWGNRSIKDTTDNTLKVLNAVGSAAPVYPGCGTALTKFLSNRPDLPPRKPVIHNGREYFMHSERLELPLPERPAQRTPAAMFYVEYLRNAKEKITLVPTGPLTNLALALRLAPDIADKIESVVIMGGGKDFSNVTPCAEANLWHDPEAAKIVTDCGARVVFIPLDATHRGYITRADCARLRALGTFAAAFAAELIEQRIIVHNAHQPLAEPDAAAVHDPLCIAYLIDPRVITDLRECHVDIGLEGAGEGQTIVDFRSPAGERNAYFALDADRHRFVDILCDCLGRGEKLN